MKIYVIKRSGEKEELTIEKWQNQVAKICKGIADVSQSMIEIKAQPHFYDGITTKEIDETTRLKISYNILQQASRYRFFKPCIKRYLVSHVKSRFFYIEPTEWEMALFLPLDRFVGANKQRVYRDSRSRI
mgnify:CR=1 FL=1